MLPRSLMTFALPGLLLLLTAAVGPAPIPTARPWAAQADPVLAWGSNDLGQLGDGTTTDRLAPVVVQGLLGETLAIKMVAAGRWHSLALLDDGTVWAWGDNSHGQLGDNTRRDSRAPVRVVSSGGAGSLTDVVQIAAGTYHSLARRGDGTVWAWGDNSHGQLGDGTTDERPAPVQVDGRRPLAGVQAIAAGRWHSLAIGSARNTLSGPGA